MGTIQGLSVPNTHTLLQNENLAPSPCTRIAAIALKSVGIAFAAAAAGIGVAILALHVIVPLFLPISLAVVGALALILGFILQGCPDMRQKEEPGQLSSPADHSIELPVKTTRASEDAAGLEQKEAQPSNNKTPPPRLPRSNGLIDTLPASVQQRSVLTYLESQDMAVFKRTSQRSNTVGANYFFHIRGDVNKCLADPQHFAEARSLSLSGALSRPSGLAAIMPAPLTHLRALNLGTPIDLSDDCLERIGNCPHLHTLNLLNRVPLQQSRATISNAALAHLSKCSELHTLTLSFSGTDAITQTGFYNLLKKLSKLQTLTLSGYCIMQEDIPTDYYLSVPLWNSLSNAAQPSLQSLLLDKVFTDGMPYLFNQLRMKELRNLSFDNGQLSAISPKWLLVFIQFHSQLRMLRIPKDAVLRGIKGHNKLLQLSAETGTELSPHEERHRFWDKKVTIEQLLEEIQSINPQLTIDLTSTSIREDYFI